MRKAENPDIRKEEFIRAAEKLFLEKGYENVSIRNVLDAVGNKTASPSVFYYYFDSKDDLYHACIEAAASAFFSGWNTAFAASSITPEDQLLQMAGMMEKSLREYSHFLPAEASMPNRLFILDVRSQVTGKMAELWAAFLHQAGICSEEECLPRAQFLAGGIGELIFHDLTAEQRNEKTFAEAMQSIIFFVLSAMNYSPEEQKKLLRELKQRKEETHGDADRRN